MGLLVQHQTSAGQVSLCTKTPRCQSRKSSLASHPELPPGNCVRSSESSATRRLRSRPQKRVVTIRDVNAFHPKNRFHRFTCCRVGKASGIKQHGRNPVGKARGVRHHERHDPVVGTALPALHQLHIGGKDARKLEKHVVIMPSPSARRTDCAATSPACLQRLLRHGERARC